MMRPATPLEISTGRATPQPFSKRPNSALSHRSVTPQPKNYINDELLAIQTLQLDDASDVDDLDRYSVQNDLEGQEDEYVVELDEPFIASDAPELVKPPPQRLPSVDNLAEEIFPHLSTSPPTKPKISPNDFEYLRVIGKGAYGKVFLVRKRSRQCEGPLFAMKVLKKASITLHKSAEHTKTERQILEEVRHPFIVQLYYAFQTNSRLYLVLSYASGGELFSYLSNERMLSEEVTAFYMGEVLLALAHLHSLGIIYRDLKPENVLLDAQGHAVLTDFGLSKVALDTSTVCGSLEYLSPEICQEHPYDKTVDFWSFGVMIYDLLTGNPPFPGQNRKKIMDNIINKKVNYPVYLSSFAKDLLRRLLKKNPKQRLGAGDTGVEDIKRQGFFRKLDWKKLADRSLTPPFKPKITSPDDTSNFSEHFTTMPVLETPVGSPHEGFAAFDGFSYTDASVLHH